MATFAKKQYFCRSNTKQAHMNIESVAAQMAVLFILVIAGFVAHKCGIMGGDFDKRLSNLVIQLTCPCLIVSSTMGDTMPDRSLILPLLGVGTLTYVALIALAYILPRFMPIRREDRGMYSFMLTFANVGFIGYPTVASIFGQSAVFYASILNAPNTFTVFIWGIMFVTGQKSGGFRWGLLYSPGHGCHLPFNTYCGHGVAHARHSGTPAHPAWRHNGACRAARHRLKHSRHAARRMMGSKGTYAMCLFRLLLFAGGRILPDDGHWRGPRGGGHQRRADRYARGLVRHNVLHEVRARRYRDGPRHVHLHPALRGQHTAADDAHRLTLFLTKARPATPPCPFRPAQRHVWRLNAGRFARQCRPFCLAKRLPRTNCWLSGTCRRSPNRRPGSNISLQSHAPGPAPPSCFLRQKLCRLRLYAYLCSETKKART